jgi:succinate dehydrogenase/fumarate reductase flavoprotein subunit
MVASERTGAGPHVGAPEVDFLVVGAGVAGLRAAVELAAEGDVLVVARESLGAEGKMIFEPW